MIISAYNDVRGNRASLMVDFDEHYFPANYTVRVNGSVKKFFGTKRGAEQAHKYYRNYVSIFEKKGDSNNAEHH